MFLLTSIDGMCARSEWLTFPFFQGQDVKNKEDLTRLDNVMNGDDSDIVIRWNHVPGHAGIEGNEYADELARQGAKEYYVVN